VIIVVAIAAGAPTVNPIQIAKICCNTIIFIFLVERVNDEELSVKEINQFRGF
jgi:hypothetical protein